MKTHLRRHNTREALCGSLPGYYEPLMLTDDRAQVTCERKSCASREPVVRKSAPLETRNAVRCEKGERP